MINRLMKSLEPVHVSLHRLYHSLLVETPSPVSPSPYEGEGELIERGAPPLLNTPIMGLGGITGGFKGGEASLPYPPPLL